MFLIGLDFNQDLSILRNNFPKLAINSFIELNDLFALIDPAKFNRISLSNLCIYTFGSFPVFFRSVLF